LAWTLWCLGYPDQALRRNDGAVALARLSNHPFSEAFALAFAAAFHEYRREPAKAQKYAEEAIALSTEKSIPLFLALGRNIEAWVLAQYGDLEEAISQLRYGIDAFRAIGAELSVPYFLILLGEIYGVARQPEQGLPVLKEALEILSRTREGWCEAELYRVKGELLLQSDSDNEEAEVSLRQAINTARTQGAKSWELRATVSLCRLWQRQGKDQEATKMLSEIYSWFTEGFDTPDLQGAKVLLEELSLLN
jgi:predicted ATPase